MFSKILTTAVFLSTLSFQVYAHALVAPALGVLGVPVKDDVQRPNATAPCGAVNVTLATVDSSKFAKAGPLGRFNATAIAFTNGTDGSTFFKARVNDDATGKGFVPMNITMNGDRAPATPGLQPIEAILPAGTKCTGGSSKDKCLVEFVSTAGFGNCVVVAKAAA
ncbi:hypothetical protein GALMADRAFT_72568 [Galerina marginata CBS 339.88]|uniref:Uncharacterized protein n=1 Tax=Galerina marginata (strain CBS 339.88) TaxID=685588 RepID=A0A067T067_GALM3|nr:hypothetical protein GALMADRAFT_72568 [Galerina marginata CBS 339.88]